MRKHLGLLYPYPTVFFFMSANFSNVHAQAIFRRTAALQTGVSAGVMSHGHMDIHDPRGSVKHNSSLTLVSSAEGSRSPELGWSRKVMQPQSVEAHTVTGTETYGLRCRSGAKTHHTHIWWNLVVRPPDWHDRNVYFSLKTFNALMQSNMQH